MIPSKTQMLMIKSLTMPKFSIPKQNLWMILLLTLLFVTQLIEMDTLCTKLQAKTMRVLSLEKDATMNFSFFMRL